MMAMGVSGGVAVTEEIWNQASVEFEGEPLGELDVKGKGLVAVYSLRHKAGS